MSRPASPVVLPDVDEQNSESTGRGGGYIVTVYDNDHNTVEEVVHILQVATGCRLEEAHIETWEVHHLGKSVVHNGSKPECERVAAVISTIRIQVSVSED